MKRICFFIGLLCLSFSHSYALNNTNQVTIIKNARIITGDGNVVEHGNMIIDGDKIKEITQGDSALPEGKVIDATGKTIIPALIDTHIHLGMLKGTTAKYENDTEENVRRQLRRYLQYGVGAVVSLGRDSDNIYHLRQLRLNKELYGPYIFTAGRGFGVTHGAPPGSDHTYRPTSVADVKRDMAELAKHKPNVVKLWVDDWRGTLPKMDPRIYQAVINEAHKYGFLVAAHVYYLSDAKALVRDGADILEHSIRDLPADQELANLMKQHHTALVPTLTLTEAFYIFNDHPAWMFKPFFKNALEPGVNETLLNKTYGVDESQRKILVLALRNVKWLSDQGVQIAFGTDSGALPTRVQGFAEHRELELLVKAGFTPMQALQIATKNSAQLFKIDGMMGTLAPGKLANFIILEANPLDNISNTQQISSVWMDGELVSSASSHS